MDFHELLLFLNRHILALGQGAMGSIFSSVSNYDTVITWKDMREYLVYLNLMPEDNF